MHHGFVDFIFSMLFIRLILQIEKEFFLMRPSVSSSMISDNWANILDKLCKLFGLYDDDDKVVKKLEQVV